MPQDTWPNGSYADFADLARRRDALRQAAAMPGADPVALLDATLVELDAAVDAAAKLAATGTRGTADDHGTADDQGTAAQSTSSAIQNLTRRMDMITAVTRLLLDNSTFSEAVTLQRCARLLAGDIASWAISRWILPLVPHIVPQFPCAV